MATGQELDIDRNATAAEMADLIFGGSVNITRADYIGDRNSSGIYSNGDSISPFATPSDSGVILSTGRVQNFTQSNGDPNRSSSTSTNTSGRNNDPDFNALAGASTYDAAFLEFDFTTDNEFLSLQFIFASEEYPEFSGSLYNDAVGIWINDTLVTSPIVQVAQVNSVNQSSNETLFVDNTGDDYNTEMDGFTVTLSVLIPVSTTGSNTLKIGVADVGDSSYDSALLIAGNSVQGGYLAEDDTITIFGQQVGVLDVLQNDGDGTGVVFVTHINGQEVNANGPNNSVTLNNGHVITLLPNGQFQITPTAPPPGATDPDSYSFSYTSATTGGLTDSAFVTVTTIPCFVSGTAIRTPEGERAVDDLQVGDLVETRDHGPQPVRWIGRRKVAAEGRFAPVVIEAGTFGFHRRLTVSPQHRIMLTHWMAELMFGEDEVLVAAKDLVNDCSVRVQSGGEVEYLHLLFDSHQIVWSEGLLTESFLPGPQVMGSLEERVRDEVLSLFPEIDRQTHLGYGPTARPALRGYEARAMLG